jgi:hypothetical protein
LGFMQARDALRGEIEHLIEFVAPEGMPFGRA